MSFLTRLFAYPEEVELRWPNDNFRRWDTRKLDADAAVSRRTAKLPVNFLERLFQFPGEVSARWPNDAFKRWDKGDQGGKHQDGELTATDMLKIAATANKTMLRYIFKHGNDAAIAEALNSPQCDIDDVVGLLEKDKVGTMVLAAIGRRRSWSTNPSVARLLCFSPKTPAFVSRTLLRYLPPPDLREIASNTALPQALIRDAMRIIEKKSRKRRR